LDTGYKYITHECNSLQNTQQKRHNAECYTKQQTPLNNTWDKDCLAFTSEFNPRIDQLSPDQLAQQTSHWVICSASLPSVMSWYYIGIKLKQSIYGNWLQLQTHTLAAVVVVTFFNHNFVNCKATLILAIKIYEIKYNISLNDIHT